MTKQIPATIAAYIKTVNAGDSEGFLDCFTHDAMVVDVQREFLGRAEIKRWSDNEIFPDNVVQTVESVREHYGDYVVLTKVEGDFDKTNLPDPLLLTSYFTLRGPKIVRLITIQMKPSDMSIKDAIAGNSRP